MFIKGSITKNILISIHDAKIIETQLNDNFKNNKKPINLIGDKGYIKGDDYRNKIYNENKINEVNEDPN